ncbi:hypothetical protein C0992_012318, partial [Termitomyces sp. T32_za158]
MIDSSISPPPKADIRDASSLANIEAHGERQAFERKTMRKIDLRLLPLLGILYALALIDRTNLGVARIAGMDRDL